MSETAHPIDLQEQLSRLYRGNTDRIKSEHSLVSATGAAPAAWTIKILGLNSYNLYDIQQVQITTIGVTPSTVGGSDTTAFNLAEPFNAPGSVAAGTYAVMWRVGNKNVFYVKP